MVHPGDTKYVEREFAFRFHMYPVRVVQLLRLKVQKTTQMSYLGLKTMTKPSLAEKDEFQSRHLLFAWLKIM